MKLTWLGHSCVLLSGSKTVLIDPFIEGRSVMWTNPDIVAVTHGHGDHLGETIPLNRRTITNVEIAKYLKTKGVPAEGMNIGGTFSTEGVTFVMTQAIHSSTLDELGPGRYGGLAAGFVIELDGIRVYHAGDTALFSDMKLIGELYRPQVALLPVGGHYTMGPDEAMIAAQYIGAATVIPIHYNTFPVIRQDLGPFKQAVERTTDLKVQVLSPGESLSL
jgi:L-ascorbate metabolism protein UlaG (beta-lactamase superfamily)